MYDKQIKGKMYTISAIYFYVSMITKVEEKGPF